MMTRILLTNDDGIHSDGLGKLEEALRAVGDVYVVAPECEIAQPDARAASPHSSD